MTLGNVAKMLERAEMLDVLRYVTSSVYHTIACHDWEQRRLVKALQARVAALELDNDRLCGLVASSSGNCLELSLRVGETLQSISTVPDEKLVELAPVMRAAARGLVARLGERS